MSVLRLDILDRAESVGIGWVFWGLILCVHECTFTRDLTMQMGAGDFTEGILEVTKLPYNNFEATSMTLKNSNQ